MKMVEKMRSGQAGQCGGRVFGEFSPSTQAMIGICWRNMKKGAGKEKKCM